MTTTTKTPTTKKKRTTTRTANSTRTTILISTKTTTDGLLGDEPVLAFGLGSNLGDSEAYLREALDALASRFGPLRVAPLYRSSPVRTRRRGSADRSPREGSSAENSSEAVFNRRELDAESHNAEYLNTVACAQLREPATPAFLRETLAFAKALEARAGRTPDPPGVRDRPRPLDVDLLLAGSATIALDAVALDAIAGNRVAFDGISRRAGAPAPGTSAPQQGFGSWPGEICVPHPQLRARRFVLQPLADLVPSLELPDGGTVVQALAALETALESESTQGHASPSESAAQELAHSGWGEPPPPGAIRFRRTRETQASPQGQR